jgi:hypothetical protein
VHDRRVPPTKSEVREYLESVPQERRILVESLRAAVKHNLPPGFVETYAHGMISYVVPLEICPDTYNGKPLLYLAIANQKHYVSVYFMSLYADEQLLTRFELDYEASGHVLHMGKSCVRFTDIDDVPFDVIENYVGACTPLEFATRMHEARAAGRGSGRRAS